MEDSFFSQTLDLAEVLLSTKGREGDGLLVWIESSVAAAAVRMVVIYVDIMHDCTQK